MMYLAIEVICAIHMLCKTGTVFLRVVEPHLFFDRISVRTIRTHMCHLLPADLALVLKQLLSFCLIPILPHIFGGGHM